MNSLSTTAPAQKTHTLSDRPAQSHRTDPTNRIALIINRFRVQLSAGAPFKIRRQAGILDITMDIENQPRTRTRRSRLRSRPRRRSSG